jgi:hypothetical protein
MTPISNMRGAAPNAAWLFSGFLVSKEGQQKIADLDNVKTSSLKLPWIVRSCASSIRPKSNRIDYYKGLPNDLFVKAN